MVFHGVHRDESAPSTGDAKGFFGKDVVELRLSKIQNISYNIPGFSGEIFGFGTMVDSNLRR